MSANLENSAVALGFVNQSVFIPIPKKGNAKENSNYCTNGLISHASKVILKLLQTRFQQHMNQVLLDVHAGFRKGRGSKDQIANILWIIEKARESPSKKSATLTMLKALVVWITTNYGKFLDVNNRLLYLPPEKPVCRSRNNSYKSAMEQWIGSKMIKKYVKGVGCILSPCLFNLDAEYIM